MERAAAEAIYDSGRDACVEFMLELAQRLEELAERSEREIGRLQIRVERLEEELRKNSRNSSKPPSSDPPKTRQERRAEARTKAKELLGGEPGQRKGGAQLGHRGSGRRLAPEDRLDEIVDHFPKSCRHCGHGFAVAAVPPLGPLRPPPGRRAAADRGEADRAPHPSPPLSAVCETKTTAALPGGLKGSAFGPRAQAAATTLSARNRISRRDMAELARDLFGLEMSVGTVDAICQRASAALAEPQERLSASVLGSPAINVDETGWRTGGEGRALWTATTPAAAVFRVGADRHRDRLSELIGDYEGIVCSDRWWAYDHLDPRCRQACWQHLWRDFVRHSEGLAEQKAFGESGLELVKALFSAWHSFGEHRDRRRLQREMAPIEAELRALCERAARKSNRTRFHRVFANNLLKIWPALWTFVTVEGVEPTNNAAERSLRGPVIHRKLSHGTRSKDGERFVERALSASVTCRLQGRSLFAYLAELLTARSRGQPLPALA